MQIDILAFGAHPDDVELSCSGTLIKHITAGKTAGIVDLTRGELGTRGTPAIRKSEAAAAARIIGVKFRDNLGLPDGFFKKDKPSILKVIKAIRRYKPQIVLAPALQDRHPDHGRAAQLISEACFLSGLRKIAVKEKSKVLKAHRPAAVYHYVQYRKLEPDFVVDISACMDQKMESIRAFRSQFYNPESNEPETILSDKAFLEYIKNREIEYGHRIGVQYAEGYNVVPESRTHILI